MEASVSSVARRGLLCGMVAVLLIGAQPRAEAKEFRRGSLIISGVWSRATVPGMPMGAGYFTIVNLGASTDILVAASSPRAERVEIHRTTEEGGVSRMRPEKTVVLPARGTVKAQPGGLHLMLVGLKRPLQAGTTYPLTLRFKNAGAVTVQVKVEAIGASDSDEHAHH
jgi:hypothetical protein